MAESLVSPSLHMATPLRWGILSTGRIAHAFAEGVKASEHGTLAAIGSRSDDSARAFAARHGIPRAYGSYEALLADPEVQAVYIATPHPQHLEWIVKAARVGKHVLCEKPLGINQAEAMIAAEACRRGNVLLMEAFMYRCHPQLAQVREWVAQGAIGEVKLVRAAFSFRAPFDPSSRLWSNALAGGGILDVGCYPVSFARLIAGWANGQPFRNPIRVQGSGHLHPQTGVDAYAVATLQFPGDLLAQVSAGVGLAQENEARIYGTDGWIEVPAPFVPSQPDGSTELRLVRRAAKAVETLTVTAQGHLYGREADAFARALSAGLNSVPEMPVADTLGNMHTLDQWRASLGLLYESERPEVFAQAQRGRVLSRSRENPIPSVHLPNLSKPMSRLIMGCDSQRTLPGSAAMWDDYWERGGHTFDTAYIYLGGISEKMLGHWLRMRGVRDEAFIVGKGGHTPFCTPEGIRSQLEESLERLQTDYVDLYLMHRDNLDVPVGELVDALDELVQAGRIKAYGGSNWSMQRIDAALAYSDRRGRRRFAAVSNQFSLARMLDVIWSGCVTAGTPEWRTWLTAHQLPLLAWSSQARGFFTDRGAPAERTDAEMVQTWHADDNFERRRRAIELARKRGVSPTAIAGAYVLHQPFPVLPLIGPRTIEETVDSLACLAVSLSPEDVAWLDLRDSP